MSNPTPFGFNPTGPLPIRTEDGAFFDPGPDTVQTLRWEWVRLEDGTDYLLGPGDFNVINQTVVGRVAAGDIDVLQTGSVS